MRYADGPAPVVRGPEPLICPGGTSSHIEKDHDGMLRHVDGSFCGHKPDDWQWQPAAPHDQSVEDVPLREWIGQALGSASMCWHPRPTTQVFDSIMATRINDALHAHVLRVIQGVKDRTVREERRANLGLATTRQLLEELKARGEMEGYRDRGYQVLAKTFASNMNSCLLHLPEEMLAYRTVDE